MSTNFCANCGSQLGLSINFCPECGFEAKAMHKPRQAHTSSNKTRELALKEEVTLPVKVFVGILVGILCVYFTFLCTILLVAIFKSSILVGILMFLIGGVGVGLLYSPVWVAVMSGIGLVIAANETQNKVSRFFIFLIGLPLICALSYIIFLLVAYVVKMIIN